MILDLIKYSFEGNKYQCKKVVEALVAEERSKQHLLLADKLQKELEKALHSTNDGMSKPELSFSDTSSIIHNFLQEVPVKKSFEEMVLPEDVNYDAVFSGYTHMQPSEPVSFAHYLSAVLAGLARDYKRYANVWDSLNLCPLGGCSMGSTSYNIDRNYTAKLLGFNGPIQNSIDCVASRDYVLETVVTLAMASDTMSRLAFDLYIWSTPEFGYIEVDDSCAVCSSIMPQKKNPFTLEHMKGLAGHMEGFVVGIYSCMKNIIYSHSKDTSVEATRYLYEAMHDMEIDFTLANITIGTLKVKKDRMRDNALRNFCTVTELANYLVRYDDISFRQAHHIVADVVDKLCKEGLDSSHIDRARVNEAMKEQLGAETKLTDELIKEALDPSRIAEAKKCIGGTSAEEVKRQLDLLEEQIDADEKVLADRLMYLAQAKEELNVAVKKLENS